MRLALALVVTGCVAPMARQPPVGDPPPDNGWTMPPGNSGCTDAECGSEVCARDGACYPAADIRAAHTSWTVHGAAATTHTCTQPDLLIQFSASNGTSFGFAPVPCSAGRFTVDKLPTFYTEVELGPDGELGTTALFDATGEATIDLP